MFLHPEQRDFVERDHNGPARVSGSAGTGKTIVALHRAVYLARRHPDARVLLATFSDTLAHALQTKLRRLIGSEPRLGERVEVHSLPALGLRLYQGLCGRRATLVSQDELLQIVSAASEAVGSHKFSLHFLIAEWEQIVDAWQLASWEAYRDVARLGRKTRLSEAQRQVLWSIFEQVRQELTRRSLLTQAAVLSELVTVLTRRKPTTFEFAVVDEAQDVNVSQLRFLAALGSDRPNGLFFAGDLGQRIFQPPFSWRSLGVDIRGRSRTLRVNYRTSHQIRQQADRLLGTEVTDVDGNRDVRGDTISLFNGPPPVVRIVSSVEEETVLVQEWLAQQRKDGVVPDEIGLFVRSEAQIGRVKAAVVRSGLAFRVLDDHVDVASGCVSITTMHLAKGLEFRSVAVVACDDEVIPLQERIEAVGDDSDLQEVYDTERHLLYVACTRARDRLLVTAVDPASEFLDDLGSG
ncbi:MAG: UvrD-helicase domain-containing protein [Limisphaerales bacterium]